MPRVRSQALGAKLFMSTLDMFLPFRFWTSSSHPDLVHDPTTRWQVCLSQGQKVQSRSQLVWRLVGGTHHTFSEGKHYQRQRRSSVLTVPSLVTIRSVLS